MTATTVSAASTASVAAGSVAAAGPATITTFAGGGVGDGGPATKAILMGGQSNVSGLGVDPSGNVLVTSGTGTYFRNPSGLGSDRVRRIDAATGVVSTVLGSASQGFSGDGGPAAQAQVSNPSDVGFDGAGNMYVLDSGNQRVRKVAAGSGVVTTVVGGGNGNNIGDFSGDGGPATKADLRLFRPEPDSFAPGQFQYVARSGLAVDQAGDLFISDANNGRIRRVDGRTGIITTVAGSGIPPNVYIPPDGLGDGGPATLAAFPTLGCGCDPQSQPGDVAVDGAGNLFIGASITWGADRVRRIDARTGIITTYAGGGSPADALGDGGPATSAAMNPTCVDVDRGGNLVLCDRGRLRRVDRTTGIITTIAGGGSPADGLGDGGPATAAAIAGPQDVAVDAGGAVYLTDSNGGRVRKVDPSSGIISTVAGGPGHIGDGGPATSARLGPLAVTTIGANTFIGDGGPGTGISRVRMVDPSGMITTVAGGGSPADGVGDGGPALSAAVLPGALTGDAAGDLLIGDRGRVRKVDGHSGIITTVAGGGNPPDGVGDGGPATAAAFHAVNGLFAVGSGNRRWPAGTLFIADQNRVRMVDPSGIVTTVAGNGSDGPFGGDGSSATSASLTPAGVVVDAAGNLLISDVVHSRIRRDAASSGIITTVAGDGSFGLAGIGLPAVQAHVNIPTGLALGADGSLFIYDGYARIVKLDSGGVLRLVAGTGATGYGGDGGRAIDAELPSGGGSLALDGSGNLFLTDSGSLRVREVHPGPIAPMGGCGQVITASLTLTHDVGPCAGTGIVVGADQVTLNLNGHRVFGGGSAGTGQYAGILVSGRTGVAVTGGQVDHFSTGVAVINSTGTTVSNMTVSDNVGSYDQYAFADGILLEYSANNRIISNHVSRNGIYDNIGVLGVRSDHNLIQSNPTTDNFSVGLNSVGIGANIELNAFLDFGLPDRGASQVGNQVIHNTSLRA